MYPIDFATCTAMDVIKRSAVCHPSVFVESLRSQALQHFTYAQQVRALIGKPARNAAAQSADSMGKDCADAADWVEYDNYEDAMQNPDRIGPFVVAFNVACKLQLIPFATRTDIMARWQAESVESAA